MQSSVRSTAPRPAPHRSASTNSIEVEHEVSIVSARANSLRSNSMMEASRKNLVSWAPSTMGGGQRAQTSHGSRSPSPNISLHRGNRAGSVSRLLSRSQSASGLRPADPDMDLLESNRESMRELSEFLRTKVRNRVAYIARRLLTGFISSGTATRQLDVDTGRRRRPLVQEVGPQDLWT